MDEQKALPVAPKKIQITRAATATEGCLMKQYAPRRVVQSTKDTARSREVAVNSFHAASCVDMPSAAPGWVTKQKHTMRRTIVRRDYLCVPS